MKRAKFTLDYLFYPTASVKANYNFKRNNNDIEPTEPVIKLFIVPKDDDHHLQMSLSVLVTGEADADPYDIDLLIVGHFSGEPSIPAEDFSQQVLVSAPNILYGAARERIMALTSRSAWGEFILPPVVFEPSDFTFPGETTGDE